MEATVESLIDYSQVEAFCRKWKIAELRVFGSAARGELRPDSDIDFLYRFEPDQKIGWGIVNAIEELKEITGRDIDFVSIEAVERSRNPHRRDRILREAQRIFPSAA